jgi:hypothetical protein
VCVVVPLLLKRNVRVLFGILRGPRYDAHPLFLLVMVLYRCDVQLLPLCCFEALTGPRQISRSSFQFNIEKSLHHSELHK